MFINSNNSKMLKILCLPSYLSTKFMNINKTNVHLFDSMIPELQLQTERRSKIPWNFVKERTQLGLLHGPE